MHFWFFLSLTHFPWTIGGYPRYQPLYVLMLKKSRNNSRIIRARRCIVTNGKCCLLALFRYPFNCNALSIVTLGLCHIQQFSFTSSFPSTWSVNDFQLHALWLTCIFSYNHFSSHSRLHNNFFLQIFFLLIFIITQLIHPLIGVFVLHSLVQPIAAGATSRSHRFISTGTAGTPPKLAIILCTHYTLTADYPRLFVLAALWHARLST